MPIYIAYIVSIATVPISALLLKRVLSVEHHAIIFFASGIIAIYVFVILAVVLKLAGLMPQ